MNEIIVRELQYKDMDDVRYIDEFTQRKYQGKQWDMLSEEEKEKSMKSRKTEFKINCETGFSFVVIKGSVIVGFILAHENLPFKNEIIIRHIAVHPDFQRLGIGTNLFTVLIDKSKKEDKKIIRSSINTDNLASIELHKQMGFQVIDWKRATLKL